MAINLATVLNQDDGRAVVEEYLNKRLLERRDWESVLMSTAYSRVDPISTHEGQYSKFTRKGRMRRPQKMATPGGAGSDPSSGANLSTNQIRLPIEWLQDYSDISTVGQMTSWIDLDAWVKEDLPVATERREHELVQNAFMVGRMVPGVWSATSDVVTTAFDQTAEATVTLYGESFTFLSAPKYYGNGKATFDTLEPGDTLKWSDIRSAVVKLSLSGAIKINGGYMCVLSESMWNDLLTDDDQGRLDAAIKGGLKTAIKGLENQEVFRYAGMNFIIDDQPFTQDSGSEGKRANFGELHSALCFGAKAYTWMSIGGRPSAKPRFKVQDISKTGFSHSIGYLMPVQVGIVNADWCLSITAPVSESKPNNYDASDPTAQLEGFATGA
jgi:hypothetical protein